VNWKSLSVAAIVVASTSLFPSILAKAESSTKLRINSIICFDRQDTGGNGRADEPYLEVNGNVVWSEKIFRTGVKNLNLEIPLNSSMARIILWERDGDDFHGSQDDYLGSTRVYATQAGFGEQKVVFQNKQKGYHYEIYYQVN